MYSKTIKQILYSGDSIDRLHIRNLRKDARQQADEHKYQSRTAGALLGTMSGALLGLGAGHVLTKPETIDTGRRKIKLDRMVSKNYDRNTMIGSLAGAVLGGVGGYHLGNRLAKKGIAKRLAEGEANVRDYMSVDPKDRAEMRRFHQAERIDRERRKLDADRNAALWATAFR